MLRDDAMLFWQSRNRCESEELPPFNNCDSISALNLTSHDLCRADMTSKIALEVAEGYAKLDLPVGVLVRMPVILSFVFS